MDVRVFDLTNRVALVTGGTRIYGSPISEALAEAGSHVIIASRNETRCEASAEQLRTRGLKASADQYDQSNESSILELRDRLVDRFGSLDILVNNSVCRSMRSIPWNPGDSRSMSTALECFDLAGDSRVDDGARPRDRHQYWFDSERRRPRFADYEGTGMTTPPRLPLS